MNIQSPIFFKKFTLLFNLNDFFVTLELEGKNE
jgi:hypothetical protein